MIAGLVANLEDWEFSSFRDYAAIRTGKLIDRGLARELIELDFDNFREQSQTIVDEEILKKIFR